jgi:hypothetical protein
MRKAILLALAAAIVAMLAIPGSASAAWTKDHLAITESKELEITGTNIQFAGAFGAYECNTISKVHFTAGTTTGLITTFEPDGAATNKAVCKGTGPQAQCEVHKFTPEKLPWVIHTVGKNALGESTVSITSEEIKTSNTGFLCLSPKLTLGTVHVSSSETNTTSTAMLSGTLVAHAASTTENVTISGTVHVLGAITYGI